MIRIGEEILSEINEIELLDDLNKENLLWQTIKARLERGDYVEAKALMEKHQNLSKSFEFKIAAEAEVYIKNNDAQKAIELVDYCLNQIAKDSETGKIDIDIIATGISHSQHDRMRTLMDIIQRLCDESKDGNAVRNDIIIEAETNGLPADKVKEALDRLKRNGQIYEPMHNRYKITEY